MLCSGAQVQRPPGGSLALIPTTSDGVSGPGGRDGAVGEDEESEEKTQAGPRLLMTASLFVAHPSTVHPPLLLAISRLARDVMGHWTSCS